MREIKFRGKRIDNGEWVYGYLFIIWDKHYILWGTTNNVPNKIQVIPETVGQFVGLKDSKGIEIYEDDIVKFVYEHRKSETYEQKLTAISKVEFFNGNFILPYAEQGNLSYWMQNGDIEIIGNTKENPELLEEK